MTLRTAMPNPERPRERLLAHGAHVLTSPELLAIILRTGVKGCDAVTLGHQLIARFKGLRGLLAADAQALLAINELNRRALQKDLKAGHALDQPQRVKHYCTAALRHLKVEHCMALNLDSQYRLITTQELGRPAGKQGPAKVLP